jgi:hypothetical protein
MSTRRKRIIAGVFFVASFILTLIGLHLYLRWDTARFRTKLARQGEKLTIKELIPAPPLSDDNGAPQLQLAASQLPPTAAQRSLAAMRLLSSGRAIVGWKQPDLRSHSFTLQTNTWEGLRTELQQVAPILADIHIALKKPAFDFHLNYAVGGTLPLLHLDSLRSTMQVLNSSTLLHLHDNNRPAAFESLCAQVALIRALENEPITRSQCARAAFAQSALRATWEALQNQGWSDVELADLQQRWRSLRFLGPFAEALTMERAMRIRDISWVQQSQDNYDRFMRALLPGQSIPGTLGPFSDDPIDLLVEIPTQTLKSFIASLDVWIWRYLSSFHDQRMNIACSQAAIEALRSGMTDGSYKTTSTRINTAFVKLGYGDWDLGDAIRFCCCGFTLHDYFAEAATDSRRLCTRAFEAETQRELVVTAIALRRYQLRHGRSPSQLYELVPEFLPSIPHDYMDGQSLRYKLNDDCTTLLYSVGLDGIDNRGNTSPPHESSDSPTTRWLSGRDWVWPQAAENGETEKYNTRIGEEIRKRCQPAQTPRKRRANP